MVNRHGLVERQGEVFANHVLERTDRPGCVQPAVDSMEGTITRREGHRVAIARGVDANAGLTCHGERPGSYGQHVEALV